MNLLAGREKQSGGGAKRGLYGGVHGPRQLSHTLISLAVICSFAGGGGFRSHTNSSSLLKCAALVIGSAQRAESRGGGGGGGGTDAACRPFSRVGMTLALA